MAKTNSNGIVVSLIFTICAMSLNIYALSLIPKNNDKAQKQLKSNLVVTILLGVSVVLNVICLVVKNKMLICNVCLITSLIILKYSIDHLVKHPDQLDDISDSRTKTYLNIGSYASIVSAGIQSIVCLNMICTN